MRKITTPDVADASRCNIVLRITSRFLSGADQQHVTRKYRSRFPLP